MSLSTPYVLLYDADCGFCQSWVRWSESRGANAVVTFTPCQFADELRMQAGLEMADCYKSAFLLHAVDNTVLGVEQGAGAINGVLRLLPGYSNTVYRWLGGLYHMPFIRPLEDMGYRIIASARYHLGKTTCSPYQKP